MHIDTDDVTAHTTMLDVLGADGAWHHKHRLECCPGELVRVTSTQPAGVFCGVSRDGVTHIDYSGSGASAYAAMLALMWQHRSEVREGCGSLRGLAA